jgi:uncharacterized protein YgbK (DUF1537 family)
VFATFYGDDFTGSTDALLQFDRFGLRSTLLVSPPSDEALSAAAERYDVIGVAGIARSLPTHLIDGELRPIFAAFARLGPQFVQYKICSTFDSSPTVGSFAPAIALAHEIFSAVALPVLPAQPEFGRYTLFANHFARAGSQTFRLDRHPTMSRHPSTPIDEADVRLLLERQVQGAVANFDLVSLRAAGHQTALAHLAALQASEPVAIVFDAIENEDLVRAGRLLRTNARAPIEANGDRRPRRPVVALGSGGLSYGLAAAKGEQQPRQRVYERLATVEKVLVVSGSCAPQTAAQIEWALERGWRGVRVDPFAWLAAPPSQRAAVVADIAAKAIEELRVSKRGVVVYSALGPEDRPGSSGDVPNGAQLAEVLGSGLGHIVRRVFEQTGLRRAIISGGDTSGFATRALGAASLEILAPLVPAGAVCRLSTRNRGDIDNAEVMLKGGQVGMRELFEIVRTGDASAVAAR